MSPPPGLRARIEARVGGLDIDAALDTGQGTLAVVGPNGAGKSCLLSCVLGALPVRSGRVAVGETVWLDTAAAIDVPLEHRRLGYVPQDYALFPHLSVRGNIDFALSSAPTRLGRRARARRVDEMLHDLGLEAYADRRTQALSGGEKQRVALARALCVEPCALLLDEPLGALDVRSRGEVREFLVAYLNKLGLPAIVVTHDAADARELGRRIAVLEAGQITQTGTWADLARRPASRFVETFVGGCATALRSNGP